MISRSNPILRSGFPRAGSPVGDQKRDEFIAAILDICGDVQLLYLPIGTETTTSTDRSRYGVTLTYDATVASRYATLGSGVSVDFNGTSGEADTPDLARFSFGDGVVDSPLSAVVLCNPDTVAATTTLLAKSNSATAEEWELQFSSAGRLRLDCFDESATADIGGFSDSGVVVAGSWQLLGASYDGQGANTGILDYKNGAVVTTTGGANGTYVAMENTAALVHLGARYTTKARFFDGRIALAILVAAQLDREQNWALAKAVDSMFDLSLT